MSICFPTPAATRVIQVPGDATTIQNAIDSAAPFDTVLVFPGNYEGGLIVSGEKRGIVITSRKGAHDTIINGRSGSRIITFDEVDTLTELSGFTLKGGDPQFDGGAVYAYRSQILIADCEFSGNATQGDGGAIALYESWALLWRNILSANSARQGGAVFANASTITASGNTFRNNQASQDGGGIMLLNAAPTLDGNSFHGNRALNAGGGVMFASNQGQFRNNVLVRNSARRGGGFVCEGGYQPDLRTTRFQANVPDDLAGCASTAIQY